MPIVYDDIITYGSYSFTEEVDLAHEIISNLWLIATYVVKDGNFQIYPKFTQNNFSFPLQSFH